MIKIREYPTGITVSGHARYGPYGQDKVCSAISSLLQTFILSVNELTGNYIKSDLRQGNAVIEYKDLDEQAQLLLESFFIGVNGIASAYPDHVTLSRKARPSVEDDNSNGR